MTYYKRSSFIKILKLNSNIGSGDVLNTNKCEISVCQTRSRNKIVIFSAIDNLIKGASGQAIQNMNLLLILKKKLVYMNKYFLIFFMLILSACGSTKTVLICGDHVCINKKEADQYFKENLTIEVKIIDKKNNKKINLVELNLKDSSSNKNISIIKKDKTKNKIKTLSKNEIEKIKRDIKIKEKTKKAEKNIRNIGP